MRLPLDESVTQMVIKLDAGMQELFEERAAIREFEGKQTRELAEALALLDVIRAYPQEACARWIN